MQKADLAFDGLTSDGTQVQCAREKTKDGMWHFRMLDPGASDWTSWMRIEGLDAYLREDGNLAWGKFSTLVPINADKIRLPE